MNLYRILSLLLQYPEREWLDYLPTLRAYLAEHLPLDAEMMSLLDYLEQGDLIDLQERYVATFDRNPSHSLHLFEHIHGESRDRGQAMVDLLQEYARHGLEMTGDELPDYVPLFLEFLAQLPRDQAAQMLGEAIDVLAHVGEKLRSHQSLYAAVFTALATQSPIVARPLQEQAPREMAENLETFGPNSEGIEPLLQQKPALQTVHFYPRQPNAARCTA